MNRKHAALVCTSLICLIADDIRSGRRSATCPTPATQRAMLRQERLTITLHGAKTIL